MFLEVHNYFSVCWFCFITDIFFVWKSTAFRCVIELLGLVRDTGCLEQRQCKSNAASCQQNVVLADMILLRRRLSSTKTVQTSGKRACSYFPECRLSSTKIRIIYCYILSLTHLFSFFSNKIRAVCYNLTRHSAWAAMPSCPFITAVPKK